MLRLSQGGVRGRLCRMPLYWLETVQFDLKLPVNTTACELAEADYVSSLPMLASSSTHSATTTERWECSPVQGYIDYTSTPARSELPSPSRTRINVNTDVIRRRTLFLGRAQKGGDGISRPSIFQIPLPCVPDSGEVEDGNPCFYPCTPEQCLEF
ncbi:hypothetical protein NMY22_g13536 [Coprinellus aureogranulatus]|nr:hypothetical protein NMY22_g13536 [Coprinellus aureogranulatus]